MNKYQFLEAYFIDRKKSPSFKWAKANDQTIALSVADMDFASPLSVKKGLEEVLDLKAYGYTALKEDYRSVFEAFYLRHHQLVINDDEIFFADGAIAAINQLIDCFSKPNDKILICPPVYHQFARIIKATGRKLVTSPLIKQDQTFVMDYEDIERRFKEGLKLMILCNPHNPTSHVYTKEELSRLGDLALKYDVYIISDEVHADFNFRGYQHTSMLSLEKYRSRVFGVLGASKTFNLALFAHSHIIIKDEKLKTAYLNFQNRHHLGSPKLMNALASYYAYRDGDEWLTLVKELIEDNYQIASSYLDSHELYYARLEGTYLMFIDLKPLLKDQTIEDFLKERDLSLNLGKDFGEGYDSYVRLNLATHSKLIKEALERIVTKGDNQC